MKLFNWLGSALLLFSCSEKEFVYEPAPPVEEICRNDLREKEVIFENEGKTWLHGGKDGWHFDISNLSVDPCLFWNYDLHREHFQALIYPTYSRVMERSTDYPHGTRCLVVEGSQETKVYPIPLMLTHEIINDTIDNTPFAVGYCILADLAAVYSRTFRNRTFTFGLSGYTYSDPKIWDDTRAFVLWDRETESLWWPLMDRSISGTMNGTPMNKLKLPWKELTWREVLFQHRSALVMDKWQRTIIPEDLNKYSPEDLGLPPLN